MVINKLHMVINILYVLPAARGYVCIYTNKKMYCRQRRGIYAYISINIHIENRYIIYIAGSNGEVGLVDLVDVHVKHLVEARDIYVDQHCAHGRPRLADNPDTSEPT